MKFFTPELFVELNSDDDDVVDQAESKWEIARKQYQKHFHSIEGKLPKSLVKFCKTIGLHDARVQRPQNPVWTVWQNDDSGEHCWATLAIRHDHAEFELLYLDPVEPTRIAHPVDSTVFHEENVICLYDEVSHVKKDIFAHDILFSNGNVLTIQFRGFKYAEVPLVAASLYADANSINHARSTIG